MNESYSDFSTSKSAPASTADLKSQFCIFASFKVATLRFTPAIRLPSRFAPRRLQPVKKNPNFHSLVSCKIVSGLLSKIAEV